MESGRMIEDEQGIRKEWYNYFKRLLNEGAVNEKQEIAKEIQEK